VSTCIAICQIERWSGKGSENTIGDAFLERISEGASISTTSPSTRTAALRVLCHHYHISCITVTQILRRHHSIFEH